MCGESKAMYKVLIVQLMAQSYTDIMQEKDVNMCLMASEEANRTHNSALARMVDCKVILKNETTPAFGICLEKVGPYSHMRVKTTKRPTSYIFRKRKIDYAIWRY
jgi:hypothetical protein